MSSIKAFGFTNAAGYSLARASQVSFTSGMAAMASRAVKTIFNRVSANRLRELEDRMLADIGLTRADVDKALSGSSVLNDPTPGLSRAAIVNGRHRFADTRL